MMPEKPQSYSRLGPMDPGRVRHEMAAELGVADPSGAGALVTVGVEAAAQPTGSPRGPRRSRLRKKKGRG